MGVWNLSVGLGRIERMFDAENIDVIPEGLDRIEPGPFLAAILSTIDPTRVSAYDRIVVLRAQKRMAAHYEAGSYQTIAAIADPDDPTGDPGLGYEAAALELQAGLRLTRRSADTELSLAVDLSERFPQVLAAMNNGDVDRPRVRVITTETAHLDTATAREVVDQVIGTAPRLTTGQLRAAIRKLCIQVDPEQAADRYHHAVEDRCLITEPTDTGTTNLHLFNLPPDKVAAAADHINHLAKQHRKPGETRTMDQLRADIAADLLTGNPLSAPTRRGIVDLHVDLKTLTELSNTPGELAGYGPVIADIARQITAQQTSSEWRWTLNHPNTGQPLTHGTTNRRPTTNQTRLVQTHNPTCVFPGCLTPSTQTDLDHTTPWAAGGPTTTNNLAPLCRHHHTQRHQHHWTYQPQPNGDHTWTSPTGHQYTTTGRAPP